jgi:hypothetical protein
MVGVDFNPAVIKQLQNEGLDVVYGDATDPELVTSLPLVGVKCVVFTVPEAWSASIR